MVEAVVGILAQDHAFDRIQGCVTRPCVLSVTLLDNKEGLVWFATYQEYTSAAGGKIFFPLSCSFLRKRFKSRKSFVTISSFSCDSQLSSREAISSASKSFCSGVSFSTHFPLSNFANGAAASAGGGAAAVDVKMDAVMAVVDAASF